LVQTNLLSAVFLNCPSELKIHYSLNLRCNTSNEENICGSLKYIFNISLNRLRGYFKYLIADLYNFHALKPWQKSLFSHILSSVHQIYPSCLVISAFCRFLESLLIVTFRCRKHLSESAETDRMRNVLL